MPDWISWDWVNSSIVWSIFWDAGKAIIMAGPIFLFLRNALGMLRAQGQVIWYWVSVPLIILIAITALESNKHNPALHIGAQYVFPGSIKVDNKDALFLAVIATVANIGDKPDTVTSWVVTVKVDGHDYKTILQMMPDSGLEYEFGGSKYKIPQEESFAIKGAVPIQPGAFVIGVLTCAVPALHPDFAKGHIFEIQLDAGDVYGKIFTTSQQLSTNTTDPKMWPGLKQTINR